MNESTYQVIYDITATSLLIENWPILVVFFIGIFAIAKFCISLANSEESNRNDHKVFAVAFIFLWFWVGGLGLINSISQHSQCVGWVNSGDYSVITGNISEFKPMPYASHQQESFTVNGVFFDYSDYDLSKCGFNNSTSHGGPIKEGLPVRISYRDGRILILEIEK